MLGQVTRHKLGNVRLFDFEESFVPAAIFRFEGSIQTRAGGGRANSGY